MARPNIPPDKRTRLVRLCGMLGSDFDGERANAGRMANDIVRGLGLTWDQVIAASGQAEQPRQERREKPPRTPPEVARFCLSSRGVWTEWERKFLNDMLERYRLSDKQAQILSELLVRAERAGPRC